jgi:cytochrome c5
MSEEHTSPIKTWQQLAVVVAAAFVVPVILIAMLASLVVGGAKRGAGGDDNDVLARIQPVGTVEFARAAGPRVALSGEQVYAQVCKACHDAGVAGAHKFGDKAAWAKVIAQGEKLTYEHAIKGLQGKAGVMPAKGGNPDLSDAEVQAAVVHMVNAAGAAWKAPAAPAAAPSISVAVGADRTGEQVAAAACGKCHQTGEGGAPKIGDRAAWIQREKRGLAALHQSALRGHAGMPARGGMADLSDTEVKRAVEFMMNSGAAVSSTAAAPAAAPAPAAAAADGKKVYDTACTACHTAGIAGAPKTGDKAAWAPRIAQGANVLYDHAIKGFQGKAGVMPAKGGNTSLSDADVKAAVDHMVAASK